MVPAIVDELRLYLSDQGQSTRRIAADQGCSVRVVQVSIARALKRRRARRVEPPPASGRRDVPELTPLFPIAAFTPRAACPHRGAILAGSSLCCMVCHRSGLDAHPALKRDPRTDPRPEPKRAAPPPAPGKAQARLTRKQKRALKFGRA